MNNPSILVVLLLLIVVVIIVLFVLLIVVLVFILIFLVVDGVIVAVHALQQHVVLMLSIVRNDFGRLQVQWIQVCADRHHIVGGEMHVGDAGGAHLAVLCEGGLSIRLANARTCLLACGLVWALCSSENPTKSQRRVLGLVSYLGGLS